MSTSRTIRFSDHSLICASRARNEIVTSSRDIGWTAVLLDHLEGQGESGVYDKHVTPDLGIAVALSGEHEVAVFRNGRWRDAVYRAGSIGLTRGGETSTLRWRNRQQGKPFRTAHLYLPQHYLSEAAEHFRQPGRPLLEGSASLLVVDDQLISSTVLQLLQAMNGGAPDLYAEHAARWLATHIVWTHGGRFQLAEDDRKPGPIGDMRLARVIEFMTKNHGTDVTIARLASEAAISPFHFGRLFREAVGITPHAYLTGLRMATARRLLAETEVSIAEIAAECGYIRATAFTAAFTRHCGAAPTAFRLRHR